MTVITGGSGTVVLKQRLHSRLQPKPKDVIDGRVKTAESHPESGTVVTQNPIEPPSPAEELPKPPTQPPAVITKAVVATASAERYADGPAADPKPRLLPRFVADVQRIHAPDPHLPDSFTQQHPRGAYEAKYRLCFGTDGRVKDVAVISGIPGADQAIISHLKETWIYRPQAVPFCTEHRFVFKLESDFNRVTGTGE
jgi:hypothetical protein